MIPPSTGSMNYGAIDGYQMNDAQQMNDSLTGKYCFATDLWGNLILWVEVMYTQQVVKSGLLPGLDTPTSEENTWTEWRKARVYDLPKLKIGV